MCIHALTDMNAECWQYVSFARERGQEADFTTSLTLHPFFLTTVVGHERGSNKPDPTKETEMKEKICCHVKIIHV